MADRELKMRTALDEESRGCVPRQILVRRRMAEAIIVTELPYQVNKAKLLETIAGLVRDKRIEGISHLQDESDRKGMRVVIELKRDAYPQIVLNQLFRMTPMQSSFGINSLAIVDGQPQVLNLKDFLVHFIDHRRDVVTRRCLFELRRLEARAHILEGYKIALENIDEVVELIKTSGTPEEARNKLTNRFGLTDKQAQAILDLRPSASREWSEIRFSRNWQKSWQRSSD